MIESFKQEKEKDQMKLETIRRKMKDDMQTITSIIDKEVKFTLNSL